MAQDDTFAPLWRRLLAALYDGLLYIAFLMLAIGAELGISHLLGVKLGVGLQRALAFGLGLAFFGWFWVHGGQTLGMRSWKIRVQRDDGATLRWPEASLRYALAWASWISVVGLLWSLFDQKRRGLHDVLARTEVVVVKHRS